MTTVEFLRHLRNRDISIWLEGEKLRFRAPEDALTPQLRAELTKRKPEIVRFLREITGDFRIDMPPIQRASRSGNLPLSFSQQRLWFLDQLEPGVPSYSIYDVIEIKKAIQVGVLQRAVTEVARRHEILRTTFPSIAGVPMQVIAPPAPVPLPVVDLSGLPEAERRREASRLAAEEAKLPFDLAVGPLLRVKLLRLEEAHYLWLLTIHHIISDDWSKKLFDQELDIIYTAFCQGLPSPLPELPIQYADFAVWQRGWLHGKALEMHVEYWAEQLKGPLPLLDLPTDRPRCTSSRGATGKFGFSRSLSEAVKMFSDHRGVTPFMTLVAGYAALLHRYTRQGDITIGSSISDRNQIETEHLIGFLLNTLVLRVRLSADTVFHDLLSHVRELCLGAYAHQEVPYEALLQRLHLNRDFSGSPFFETMLGLLNTPAITKSSAGFWGPAGKSGARDPELPENMGEPYTATSNNGTAKFDLSISLTERGQQFVGTTEYNTDLFDHETISRLVERFQILLHGAVSHPEKRLSELPLIGEPERRQLIFEFSSGKDVPVAKGCIHQLFEAQARRTPDAVAVEFHEERLTYRELNARANQVAHWLKKMGAGPEMMVGIWMERSIEMLLAILAVIKSGAAYVPLDPMYPSHRIGLMLEDSRASIVLTKQSLLTSLSEHTGSTIALDNEWTNIAKESEENLVSWASAENLVCILYTSGSTGLPKGVMITHGALANYTLSAMREYELVPQDRVLQFASMSFDASMEDIFPCLSCGATLVLRTEDMLDSTSTFLARCGEMAISVVNIPTAYWHEIVARLDVEQIPSTVLLLIIGGEKALPAKWAVWQKFVGDRVALFNTYGPTEGTIVVTRCRLRGVATGEVPEREVPIGVPIENTRIYVLDRWMQPVPAGIVGEVYIGGIALARGYLNRSDLTAERFVPDSFSGRSGARLYKTGDLVRFLWNGKIEYRGRTDHQVKIRGYRIEPAEIEAVLEQHEGVKEALVLAREDHPGLKQLVAYVVLRPGVTASAADLRKHLKQLPEYMMPVAFVFLSQIPLTPSGKIDRLALPDLDRSRAGADEHIVEPRTPTELALASIWKEILRLDRIGANENFFELGGHSLLATQIVARISDALHIDLPLRKLFEMPTISEFSALADQMLESGASEKSRIISVRRLLDSPNAPDAAPESSEKSAAIQRPDSHQSSSDVNISQMIAGLEGLTDQEVNALLGEEGEAQST